MDVKNQTSRVVLAVTMVLGLLLTLQVNIWPLVGPLAALLVIIAGLSSILTTKFPHHMLLIILALLFGPFFFCFVFTTVLNMLTSTVGLALSKPLFFVLLLLLMVVSFLYARWHLTHLKNQHPHRNELQTNERKPMLPVGTNPESEVERCAASESSSASSGAD
jgi:hypothetical protein